MDQNPQNMELPDSEVEKLINTRYKNAFISRLQEFYDEYFLSDFQKFAVNKFIKENIGILS